MRFRGGRGLAMVSSMLLAAAARSSPAPPLATYRGGEVTADEYAGWLKAERRKDEPAQRRVYLESVALAETLEREAIAAGLERDPEVRFRLEEAERGVLVQAFQRRENQSQAAAVTDAEVEAELEAEKGELSKPRRVQLRNIFRKVPAGASRADREAARASLEDVRRRLLAGADFGEVALRESDSQTRFQGGAMGAIPPGVMQPEVERVAFALREGELSPVIETPDGFTLLRCEAVVEARVMPLQEARSRIRQGLFTRRSEARQRALREELLEEAAIQETLDAALAAGGGEAVAARFQGAAVTLADLRWSSGSRPESLSREALRLALEEHVFRVKLAERARREGQGADPEVRARIRWARARVLATFEITRRVGPLLVPLTEAELRAHYEANRQKYQRPPEMDFSVIQLTPAPGARQGLQEAEALVGTLRSGQRDFAEAARSLSRHASAREGGRLGWLTTRQAAALGPAVHRALTILEPGQVLGPVQQDETLWVLKLWDRRPARPLSFEEARARVEQELGNARVAEIQERLEADARRALDLRVTSPATAP